MRRLLLLAVALVGATPCGMPSPPVGLWSYGEVSVMPMPGASIALSGSDIVIQSSPADRAFTSTTSRYDERTLDLRSSNQHGSCCAHEWTDAVTRNADGSYDIIAKILAPGSGGESVPGTVGMKETTQRAHVPASGRPAVVSSLALLPWIYHVTHATIVDDLLLPDPYRDSIKVQTLGVAEAENETVPPGFPSDERALRITPESGPSTLLWYDPCSFVVDGYKDAGRLIVRNGLGARR